MRSRSLVVLAVAAVAALGAVSSSHSEPGSNSVSSAAEAQIPVLRVGFPFFVPLLDQSKAGAQFRLSGQVLETLLTYDKNARLVPNLARSWSMPSTRRIVFNLRRDARFSDGTPLTSADVVYSLNYWKDSSVRRAYNDVASIRANGRYTVIVQLNKVNTVAPYTFGRLQSQIFQEKFHREHIETYGQPSAMPVGTGPWRYVSFNPTQGAELAANPHWWGGKPPSRRISIKFYAGDQALALAFRAGEIDAGFPGSGQVFATTSGQLPLVRLGCNVSVVGLDVTSKPWNDIHVRRAVAYALKPGEAALAYGGFATQLPTVSMITPQALQPLASQAKIDALFKAVKKYPYSIARAKAEMAQTPYAKDGVSITATAAFVTPNVNLLQYVQRQLGMIGINVKINTPVSLAQADAVRTGPRGTQDMTFSRSTCQSPDASFHPSVLLGSENNVVGSFNMANYAPKAVDDLMLAGIGTASDAKRFAAYSALTKRLANDVPYVGLFVENALLAIDRKKFKAPTFGMLSFQNAWGLTIEAK